MITFLVKRFFWILLILLFMPVILYFGLQTEKTFAGFAGYAISFFKGINWQLSINGLVRTAFILCSSFALSIAGGLFLGQLALRAGVLIRMLYLMFFILPVMAYAVLVAYLFKPLSPSVEYLSITCAVLTLSLPLSSYLGWRFSASARGAINNSILRAGSFFGMTNGKMLSGGNIPGMLNMIKGIAKSSVFVLPWLIIVESLFMVNGVGRQLSSAIIDNNRVKALWALIILFLLGIAIRSTVDFVVHILALKKEKRQLFNIVYLHDRLSNALSIFCFIAGFTLFAVIIVVLILASLGKTSFLSELYLNITFTGAWMITAFILSLVIGIVVTVIGHFGMAGRNLKLFLKTMVFFPAFTGPLFFWGLGFNISNPWVFGLTLSLFAWIPVAFSLTKVLQKDCHNCRCDDYLLKNGTQAGYFYKYRLYPLFIRAMGSSLLFMPIILLNGLVLEFFDFSKNDTSMGCQLQRNMDNMLYGVDGSASNFTINLLIVMLLAVTPLLIGLSLKNRRI